MVKNRGIQLAVALLTVGIDFFHLGLVYPLFSELLLGMGGKESWQQAMIYAAFIVAFPFGQFVGSPYLGRLSDKYGRRKLLFISVAGSAIGMAICASGVMYNLFSVIFLGRLLGGCMGANLSLAYAAIVDLSTPKNKVRNLSLIPLSTSIGFAFGPLMMGMLDNLGEGIFGRALPLWVAVGLSILNWVALWLFEESSPVLINKVTKEKSGWLIKDKRIFLPISVIFLMVAANFLLLQYIGPFSVEVMGADLANVSWLYVNMGISCMFGHLLFTRNLANLFTPRMLLPWALAILACSLIAVTFSDTLLKLHITLAFAMICCAVAYTNSIAYLSDHVGPQQQGEVMGLAVSTQCLAEWLPPLCLGVFIAIMPPLPMLFGAAACLLGIFIVRKSKTVSEKIAGF